jgi:hypothetical protein
MGEEQPSAANDAHIYDISEMSTEVSLDYSTPSRANTGKESDAATQTGPIALSTEITQGAEESMSSNQVFAFGDGRALSQAVETSSSTDAPSPRLQWTDALASPQSPLF